MNSQNNRTQNQNRNIPNRAQNARSRQGAQRAQMQASPMPVKGQGAPRPQIQVQGGQQRPVQRPQRPPMPKVQTKPQQSSTIALGEGARRNVILVSVFLALLLVFVIVMGVQSCTREEKDRGNISKDHIMLATDTAVPSQGSEGKAVFAVADENTKKLSIDSSYGVLIDLDTNKIVASKKSTERMYPASMTKIMTLIVAYENISDLTETYTFDAEMLDYYYREGASVAGFKAGETVPAKDLLYGCILPSGADATGALSKLVAGSEEGFADLMNAKVEELGLRNTHFVTASGLHDDDHYSTCEDMAAILRYALSDPVMKEVLSTYKYTTTPTPEHPDGIPLVSDLKKRMAGDEAEGFFVQGGKTGYTHEAKHCLATFGAACPESLADKTQPQYVLITAKASGNEYSAVFDAIKVYEKYCAD